MNIRQVLVTHQKRALIVLLAVAAISISIVGYYSWHKHQTNARVTRQNLDLGVSDPRGVSVAFFARYGYLQGSEQQQKDLVAKYGTASFINSYKPVENGGSDPILCSDKPLAGVSINDSQPYNKYTLDSLALNFRDGSSTTVDVEIASQTSGAKINSVTCHRSHASDQIRTVPGPPGMPPSRITE